MAKYIDKKKPINDPSAKYITFKNMYLYNAQPLIAEC
jgi:hypothetical protein